MHKEYLKLAYKQALIAYKNGDVPIGCIIVKNNEIISRAYNKKQKTNIATKHAELIAIEKACKKLNTWHLEDCIIYTTIEPCIMCVGAIIQSRIKTIVYGEKNEKYGAIEGKYTNILNKNKINIIKINNNKNINLIMKKFFKNKR